MPRKLRRTRRWNGEGGLLSTPGTLAGARAQSAGYTLVELVIVMLIAALLLGLGVNSLNKAASQRATTSARDGFIWMARRARNLAIQQGTRVRVVLYPDTAKAQARLIAPGHADEFIALGEEYKTRVSAGGADSVWICYEARGYANTACTSTGLPVTVTFTRGTISARAVVQGLGQVEAK